MLVKNPKFEISAVSPKQYPTGNLPEIVFSGTVSVTIIDLAVDFPVFLTVILYVISSPTFTLLPTLLVLLISNVGFT